MNKLKFHFLLLLLVIISACSTSSKIPQKPIVKDTLNSGSQVKTSSQKSINDIAIEKLFTLTDITPNLSIEGSMRVTGIPIGISFEAVIKRKDSLKLILTGPFGISVGALSATPDHFIFYNARQDEVIEGTPNKETFKKLIQIDMDYYDIVSLLRGELSKQPVIGNFTVQEFKDSLCFKTTLIPKEEYTILQNQNSLQNYTRYSDLKNKEITVKYSDFKSLNDKRLFAMKSDAQIFSSNQNLRLSVDEVKDEIENGNYCTIKFNSL
jgi:hypothetical protein